VDLRRVLWLIHLGMIIFVGWQGVMAMQAADLVTYLRDVSGRTASYLLLGTLLFAPLSRLWPRLRLYIKVRRYLGLWGFCMVLIHVIVWVSLEFAFDWSLMWQEVNDNLFIWLGLVALILLLPMAVTSNNKAVRRLGFRRWQGLHSVAYLIVPLSLGHYFMAQKVASGEPIVLLLVLLLLMFWRFKYAD